MSNGGQAHGLTSLHKMRWEAQERYKRFYKKMDKVTLRIRNVPVEVCESCGEKFYSLKVARKIDVLVKSYREMISKTSPNEIMAKEIDFSTPGADEACA